MPFKQMFVTAVCVLLLWTKKTQVKGFLCHKCLNPRSPVARPWTRTLQLQTFTVSQGFDGFTQFFFLIFTKLCILFENKKKKFGVGGTLSLYGPSCVSLGIHSINLRLLWRSNRNLFVSSKLQRLKYTQTIFSFTFFNLFRHQMVHLLLLIYVTGVICRRRL